MEDAGLYSQNCIVYCILLEAAGVRRDVIGQLYKVV
jgi:hypothetical protein